MRKNILVVILPKSTTALSMQAHSFFKRFSKYTKYFKSDMIINCVGISTKTVAEFLFQILHKSQHWSFGSLVRRIKDYFHSDEEPNVRNFSNVLLFNTVLNVSTTVNLRRNRQKWNKDLIIQLYKNIKSNMAADFKVQLTLKVLVVFLGFLVLDYKYFLPVSSCFCNRQPQPFLRKKTWLQLT